MLTASIIMYGKRYNPELTAVVRSRQLHIYRNGKKVLVLKGKAEPQIVSEDPVCELLKGNEQR